MEENICKVVTGRVRFSYCNIFKARAFNEGDEAKYSLCILIPKKDTLTIKKIKAAIAAATELGKASKWGGKVPKKLWNPLRDGEEREDEAPEYKDCYFLQAKSKDKPGIVDDQLNEILDSTEVYSGCYGRVSLNFFPYNSNGSNGVGVGLNNVQKLADGEPLGGARASAEDDFADSRPDLHDDDDLGL